jgi:hypothetical protein
MARAKYSRSLPFCFPSYSQPNLVERRFELRECQTGSWRETQPQHSAILLGVEAMRSREMMLSMCRVMSLGILSSCSGQTESAVEGGDIGRIGDASDLGLSEAIAVADTAWLVGRAEGAAEETFGRIVDAALDQDGNVYVLDAGSNVVRKFDRTGRFIAWSGGPGVGPGEFAVPRSVLHVDGALYVLDSRNGIIIFDTNDTQLRYARTVKLGFEASDFCFLRNNMFVFGAREGRLISEVTRDGTVLRAFGDLFGPPEYPLVQRVVSSEGRIACFPREGALVVSTDLLPDIRSYNVEDGSLRWETAVPEFATILLQVSPDGRQYSSGGRPGIGFDVIRVLQPVGDKYLLIQSRRQRNPDAPREIVGTCVAQVDSGICIRQSTSLPLLPAINDRTAVGVSEELFPVAMRIHLNMDIRLVSDPVQSP